MFSDASLKRWGKKRFYEAWLNTHHIFGVTN
jgi:hypothetical protein